MKLPLLIPAICLFFCYCTPKSPTTVVMSDEKDGVNLGEYKTFAWLPPDASYGELAILAVENELEKRGYSLDTENPDFLVMVHIIQEETDEEVVPPLYNQYDQFGPDYYSGPYANHYYTERIMVPIASGYPMEERDYVAGTVIVDFIDLESSEVVWRGMAEDARNSYIDILNDLPGYIAQIFENYPVQAKE